MLLEDFIVVLQEHIIQIHTSRQVAQQLQKLFKDAEVPILT